MASIARPHDPSAIYREAHDLLCRSLALIDSVEDTLTAAQLCQVIELVEMQITPRSG